MGDRFSALAMSSPSMGSSWATSRIFG